MEKVMEPRVDDLLIKLKDVQDWKRQESVKIQAEKEKLDLMEEKKKKLGERKMKLTFEKFRLKEAVDTAEEKKNLLLQNLDYLSTSAWHLKNYRGYSQQQDIARQAVLKRIKDNDKKRCDELNEISKLQEEQKQSYRTFIIVVNKAVEENRFDAIQELLEYNPVDLIESAKELNAEKMINNEIKTLNLEKLMKSEKEKVARNDLENKADGVKEHLIALQQHNKDLSTMGKNNEEEIKQQQAVNDFKTKERISLQSEIIAQEKDLEQFKNEKFPELEKRICQVEDLKIKLGDRKLKQQRVCELADQLLTLETTIQNLKDNVGRSKMDQKVKSAQIKKMRHLTKKHVEMKKKFNRKRLECRAKMVNIFNEMQQKVGVEATQENESEEH